MELLPKVIYYSYECINKSKQTNFLTLRKLFWEASRILNYITNQQKFSNDYFKGLFFAFTKLSPARKFAGGIRELQAAPIAFAIYRWDYLNLK